MRIMQKNMCKTPGEGENVHCGTPKIKEPWISFSLIEHSVRDTESLKDADSFFKNRQIVSAHRHGFFGTP
jgi:hypothetical protein